MIFLAETLTLLHKLFKKRHRFSVAPPVKTEKHRFTAPNTVLHGAELQSALADFRSRGSYSVNDQNDKVVEEIESGEMMASSFNSFDKIYEYSLVYSSYCLGREDTLLCAEPSPVPLVPYSS